MFSYLIFRKIITKIKRYIKISGGSKCKENDILFKLDYINTLSKK